MKSIDNIKKLTPITIAIFITATLIASTPVMMAPDVYADHPGEVREGPTETIAPETIAPL